MREIFKFFYNKQPSSILEVLEKEIVRMTFLNPYSIYKASEYWSKYEIFDYIGSDGLFPVFLHQLVRRKKILRISFDMTSLAQYLFPIIVESQKSLVLIGSDPNSINSFVDILIKKYPDIRLLMFHHGYFDNSTNIIRQILSLSPDYIIIGMGTPKQDLFAFDLVQSGYKGSLFTCGGFFHQTTDDIKYYPSIIDKFNLRFIYRIYKEPYVAKRLIKYYPKFFFQYTLFLLKKMF